MDTAARLKRLLYLVLRCSPVGVFLSLSLPKNSMSMWTLRDDIDPRRWVAGAPDEFFCCSPSTTKTTVYTPNCRRADPSACLTAAEAFSLTLGLRALDRMGVRPYEDAVARLLVTSAPRSVNVPMNCSRLNASPSSRPKIITSCHCCRISIGRSQRGDHDGEISLGIAWPEQRRIDPLCAPQPPRVLVSGWLLSPSQRTAPVQSRAAVECRDSQRRALVCRPWRLRSGKIPSRPPFSSPEAAHHGSSCALTKRSPTKCEPLRSGLRPSRPRRQPASHHRKSTVRLAGQLDFGPVPASKCKNRRAAAKSRRTRPSHRRASRPSGHAYSGITRAGRNICRAPGVAEEKAQVI